MCCAERKRKFRNTILNEVTEALRTGRCTQAPFRWQHRKNLNSKTSPSSPNAAPRRTCHALVRLRNARMMQASVVWPWGFRDVQRCVRHALYSHRGKQPRRSREIEAGKIARAALHCKLGFAQVKRCAHRRNRRCRRRLQTCETCTLHSGIDSCQLRTKFARVAGLLLGTLHWFRARETAPNIFAAGWSKTPVCPSKSSWIENVGVA